MSNICEFKKGNWLFRKKPGGESGSTDSSTYKVDQISSINENLIVFSLDGADIRMEVDEIQPIPLDKDILSACGFELVMSREGIVVYSKEVDRGKIFVSNLSGKGWKLSSELDGRTYLDVPYVHVLQNKYRRMVQKELKVNLSNLIPVLPL